MAEPERGAEAVPEAAKDASRGPGRRTGDFGRAGAFGWLLLFVALAGAVLLVVAEFSELSHRTIGIGACSSRENPGVCSTQAHEQHGYALLILALVTLPMAWGAAVGRSRAAALAVAVIGAAVLGIALLGDYPDRDDVRGLDARYTQVQGHLGPAFKLELVGGVLLVLAGGLALARPAPPPEPRRRRPREGEPAAT